MNTYHEVIDSLGGRSVLAGELNEDYGTVHQWYRRNSIPSAKWQQIVQVASRLNKPISYDLLAAIAAGRTD